MDKISVIVPVYNVEKHLDRCVQSILNQTYNYLEIILVDDGSTDSSGYLCDKYKSDSRVTVVHKENGGLGFARNSGLDIATGKYITFVDSDDYIKIDHLKNMYLFLIENEADTCISGYTKVYANKQIEFKNVCNMKVYECNNVVKEILPRMTGKKSDGKDYIEMSVCMALLSNEIIKKNLIRFHSEKEYISEDLIFDFDYYPNSKKLCVTNDVGYYYCDNEGSLTTKYRLDRFEAQKKLYKELRNRADELGILHLCEDRMKNTLISIARYCIKLEVKYYKQDDKANVIKKIEGICSDGLLLEVLLNYNDSKVPWKSRLINNLIKHKSIRKLWCVEIIKNYFDI